MPNSSVQIAEERKSFEFTDNCNVVPYGDVLFQ